MAEPPGRQPRGRHRAGINDAQHDEAPEYDQRAGGYPSSSYAPSGHYQDDAPANVQRNGRYAPPSPPSRRYGDAPAYDPRTGRHAPPSPPGRRYGDAPAYDPRNGRDAPPSPPSRRYGDAPAYDQR